MIRIINIACFLLLAAVASAQISPGDLSTAHAELEGITNCTKCHELGKKVLDSKCLDCHTDIAERIDNNKGYHVSADVKGISCIKCHSEHHGRDFDLMHLNKETFNHDLTGYALEGEHKTQDCVDCHKLEFIVDSKQLEKKNTYLGLDQSCIACHNDYHRETLSNNCLDCHNYDAFKPAPGFDHNQTNFTLKGQHKKVECIDCHKKEMIAGEMFQHFSNVEHANCTSCHQDVHDNKFGQNCTKCHTEQSFKQVKGLEGFNHDATGYPLEGMHSNVDCAKCHKTCYTDPLKHNLCSDCHTDYHKGEMTNNGINPDCKDCHTVAGFPNSLFTIEEHNQGSFKLEGGHLATPCFACHKKQDDWHFRNIGTTCSDCHTNVHEGYMDKKFTDDEGCKDCHAVYRWPDVKFDHEQTEFSLLGVHASTECRECHYRSNQAGEVKQAFTATEQACLVCHSDEHRGQFDKYGESGCKKCHGFDDWTAEKFDHNDSRFKLDGAHASVECYQCHTLVRSTTGRYVKFIFEDIKCATCHK